MTAVMTPYRPCFEPRCERALGHEERSGPAPLEHTDAKGRSWRTPRPKGPFQPIPFLLTYPAGHELAGKLMERVRECSRCQRDFTQFRINPAWLNSFKSHKPPLDLEAFLKTCEVTEARAVYIPARCGRCERATLNRETQPLPVKLHA